MLTAIWAILIFLIVILIHELGHFIVAKSVGIKVNEFAIGMGPKIFQKQKGETKYTLRLLPIGGYVSMEGEDEDSADPRSFNMVPVGKRIAVVLAGAIMNFALAIIILSGIYISFGTPSTTVGQLIEGSPAYTSNLEVGDRIVSIDGVKISSWDDISKSISRSEPNKLLNLEVVRNGENVDLEISPVEDKGKTVIGIVPKNEKNFIKGIKEGFLNTGRVVMLMFDFIASAFRGNVSLNDFSGPVGVVNEIGKAAKTGIYDIMFMLAFININLGFFNLLPIPALDGGRAFFLFIELLRGKPINPEKEGFVHFVGFVLLMSLMLVVTFKDIIKL